MNKLNEKIQTMVTLMGFSDFKMDADEDTRRVSLVIYDKVASKENIPTLVLNLERLARLMAKQLELPPAIIDVNYCKIIFLS